ncbi:uncharacterized protein [Coffea arabica]|uniref:Glabrous enhancer-binding protein-like DBD domain-containing protein n=1 Tax=Coffea arabica TaxID=13443 RepID=A0A6P6TIN9_COFAR
MAKPRETAKPDPPVESEEEEESGEEEEEGSSEESESQPENEPSEKKTASTPAPATKKPESATPKTQPTSAAAAASSSDESEDEESGSDTDSDTETPSEKPDPSIKPIASKPMDGPQKTTTTAKKPRSKPNALGPTSPAKSTTGAGAKRTASAAGSDEGKDAKRSKKKPEAEAESSERKGNSNDDLRRLFQRLWSEDDEIAILKGMLDYSAKKKADPINDLNAFLEFIKKNIHTDVSKTQLQDKIRRLKKKYENNAEREKKGNKELTFSKPHEQKAYEFSKKVWGKEKNGDGEENVESTKANGTAVRKSRSRSAVVGMTPKVDEVEEKLKEVKDLVGEKNVVEGLKNESFGPTDSLRIEEWVLKNGAHLIKDAKKRAELEEKWRELKVKEIELLARRSELMAEQSNLVLEGLK